MKNLLVIAIGLLPYIAQANYQSEYDRGYDDGVQTCQDVLWTCSVKYVEDGVEKIYHEEDYSRSGVLLKILTYQGKNEIGAAVRAGKAVCKKI